MGPAIETMRALERHYDVIFIDADKLNYVNYYLRAKEMLSPEGVILIDNVLWDGDVLCLRRRRTNERLPFRR